MTHLNQINPPLVPWVERLPKAKEATASLLQFFNPSKDYIWDPWILHHEDYYRLFYLGTQPKANLPFWSGGKIYGAISSDLIHWRSLGVMLEPDPNLSWANERMLAGSIYFEDGVYYLFFSASAGGEHLGDERITFATSTDGLHWQWEHTSPLFTEDQWRPWYGLDGTHFHWRDPYLFKDYDGKYYLLICTYLNQAGATRYRACVGLAIADQPSGPYTLQPPIAAPSPEAIDHWAFAEMERPQVIYRFGQYHLFCSCWEWNIHPEWRQKWGRWVKNSSTYWLTCDRITGPYTYSPECPVVPGSEKTGLYGTNFFPHPTCSHEFFAYGWYYRFYALELAPRFRVEWTPTTFKIHPPTFHRI